MLLFLSERNQNKINFHKKKLIGKKTTQFQYTKRKIKMTQEIIE